MVLITYATFKSVMNISDVSPENIENILELSIDNINLYGKLELANMSGTAGSKTVSVDSKTKAAIFHVARVIYYSYFKGIISANAGGLITVTSVDLMSNPVVVDSIREAVRQLEEKDWEQAII